MGGDTDLDLDKAIDATVDSFIDDVAPGTETPPADDKAAPPAAPAVTSLAKPAAEGGAPADIPYPKSWMKDHEALWPKVPEPLRKYISETREKDYLNGLEQYKSGHQAYAEINSIISPYMPRLTSIGMAPAQAIKSLLNADWALSQGTPEQKYQMLADICKTYGLDPTKISAGGEPAYQTEEAKALAAKLASVEGTLHSFLGSHVARQREEINKEVVSFAADPAHPYFEEVGDHIARLLGADKTLSLKDAYEQAIWANPVTRAKELERLNKANAETDRKAREEAARKARLSRDVNVRGKITDKTTGAAKGSWEDDLAPTLAAINAKPH